MHKNVPPFPPIVDLQSANWSLYGSEGNKVIAVKNNQVVANLATQRIEFNDHVYDFPRVLKRYREASK